MAVTWNVARYDGDKTSGSLSDVLTTLHWTATDSETVSDVKHTGYCYGTVQLAAANSSSFIAFGSVTKDNLIAWAKAALGSDEVTAIETNIAAQITESKTPTTLSGEPS